MSYLVRLLLLAMLCAAAGNARAADGSRAPAYQRTRPVHAGAGYVGTPPSFSHRYYPQRHFSGGHFQRPYPYHLDYYRMRWGGSYAPYFGNLYGPPNVYAPVYGGYGGYPVPYVEQPPEAP